MKKIRGGQIFGFTTVKPKTSKWPGRVLVIDRKILRPFLESSNKTVISDRSSQRYLEVWKIGSTLMSSIGRPEHYLLEYVYSARLVQNNQSTNMYIGIKVATTAFFFNVLWTFTEDACYSINRKINWIWGTTIIIRTRFKI